MTDNVCHCGNALSYSAVEAQHWHLCAGVWREIIGYIELYRITKGNTTCCIWTLLVDKRHRSRFMPHADKLAVMAVATVATELKYKYAMNSTHHSLFSLILFHLFQLQKKSIQLILPFFLHLFPLFLFFCS